MARMSQTSKRNQISYKFAEENDDRSDERAVGAEGESQW